MVGAVAERIIRMVRCMFIEIFVSVQLVVLGLFVRVQMFVNAPTAQEKFLDRGKDL